MSLAFGRRELVGVDTLLNRRLVYRSVESLPSAIAGRYRPIRIIGQGGMGVVYEVEHIHTGEHLALKTLLTHAGANAQLVERFKREARASAKIKSEHIVRVSDADVAAELGGTPFLVMELLVGMDLEHVCEQRPQLTGDVLEWLHQVARGLDKAHAAGIIHRDLKPENLFLSRREDGFPLVKILDFGIARIRSDEPGDSHRTATGAVFGTPKYMAPEQATGKTSDICPATDLWAISMIAFRLLTGRDYWSAQVSTHVLAQIIYEPVVPPSQRGLSLGEAFDAWFLKGCAKDPKDRFASAGEQLQALAVALGVSLPTSVPELRYSLSIPISSERSGEPEAPTVEAATPLSLPSMGSVPTLTHPSLPAPLVPTSVPRSKTPSVLALVALVGAGVAVVVWVAFSSAAPKPAAHAELGTSATTSASSSPNDTTPIPSAPASNNPGVDATSTTAVAHSTPSSSASSASSAPPTKRPSAPRPSDDPLGDQH